MHARIQDLVTLVAPTTFATAWLCKNTVWFLEGGAARAHPCWSRLAIDCVKTDTGMRSCHILQRWCWTDGRAVCFTAWCCGVHDSREGGDACCFLLLYRRHSAVPLLHTPVNGSELAQTGRTSSGIFAKWVSNVWPGSGELIDEGVFILVRAARL